MLFDCSHCIGTLYTPKSKAVDQSESKDIDEPENKDVDKPKNKVVKIKCFISVMAFKNQGRIHHVATCDFIIAIHVSVEDLRKQFTKKHLTCVLDYMTVYPD